MKRVWSVLALSLLLSAGTLFLLVRKDFDPGALANLVQVNSAGLALLVLCLLAWWVVAGWRIQVLAADMGGRVTLSRATRAYILGLFSACVTPSASGMSVAIGWYLSRYLSARHAAGIAVYTLVLDLVFYAWALPLSFFALERGGVNLGVPNLGAYVAGFALFAVAFAWALAYRVAGLSRFVWGAFGLRPLRRWRRQAYAFVSRTGRVLGDIRRMGFWPQLSLHVSTALMYVLHFAVLNAVAVMLGLEVHHLNVLAVQALVMVLGFLVPTPGGSGYFEAAFAVTLTGQVPEQAKVLLILMWRLFSYYLYFLIGPAIGGMALLRATARADGHAASTVTRRS